METIGRLAGNIAHDFNNLLGAIMMATDFLLNAHRPTDPSFQDIMQIKQNANRAASLVRQLLAFSRKQTMRPVVLDLGEALSDLTVLLKRLIGENITLNVPQVRDLWPVKADVHQFEQVVINLAINARDAMPLGGTLTLRTGNVSAEESAPHQHQGMPFGEYVRVEVEDTGSGIAPEIIDKIFDPFYTTKDIGKGTGLGLSTVYGIVKQTGGFIFVESELGKGTIFRIFLPRYIPVADDLAVPQLPETTAPALAGALSAADAMRTVATDLTGHGTILLVEDEEELRALNARGLQVTRLYRDRGRQRRRGARGARKAGPASRCRGVRRGHAGNGRPDADEGAQATQTRHQDHLRVGLRRGRVRQDLARPQAVQLPGQAVHAQAARHRGEGDDGGVSGGALRRHDAQRRPAGLRPRSFSPPGSRVMILI